MISHHYLLVHASATEFAVLMHAHTPLYIIHPCTRKECQMGFIIVIVVSVRVNDQIISRVIVCLDVCCMEETVTR